MADDTEERQLDEFGFPIPTEEELAAERAKTDQVIQLSGAAQALENQLPSDMPPSPMATAITPPMEPGIPLVPTPLVASTDVVTPPPTPLNLPVSSGRMYMGPAMTPAQETAFHALPSGSSINLVAPPTPEASEGAAARVAYAGRTFGGGGPYDPEMERFRAQQAIQSAVAKGMPISDAVRLYGMDMFGTGTTGKRYNVHGVGLVDESGRVLRAAPTPPARPVSVAGVGLVDPTTGKVIVAPTQTETVTEVIPATEGSPGSPAIPASKGFLGIGAHPAVPEVPPTPARGEQRITRKVPVKKAAETKGKLTKDQAAIFLNRAGGDKAKARKMAVDAGYAL